nr:ABC transporter permease [uncultured Oscillibacter sp.]
MTSLIISILSSSLRSSVVLILTAVGGTFSNRAGVSDLGLEGIMLTGSFFAVWGSYLTGNPWIGLLFGGFFGVLISMLHAVMHITYRVNASISGMCVNLLATAATPLLLTFIYGMNGKSVQVTGFSKINSELLGRIPFIGPILNAQSILLYLSIILVVAGWVFMYRTTLGLRMRMVGENPQAASTVGLNVTAYKYFGVAMSGLFGGLGGAYLSLSQMNMFVENMTDGRGYIAVVISAFGRYNPLGATAGSLFFGFFDSLQTVFQSVLPSHLVRMAPYLFTLIVLVFGMKHSAAPAGIGKHVEN